MTRDMELVRKILLEMERRTSYKGEFEPVSIEGYNDEQVSYHIKLLCEAGLMEGVKTTTSSASHYWVYKSLTWDGHDFLDAAREDTRWNKALKMGREKAGALTFELLKELLVSLARGALGTSVP